MKIASFLKPYSISIPLCYLLLLAGLYYAAVQWLVLKDWGREDFNYAYLIPAVVAYLIWEKRSLLAQTPSRPSWWGMAPILIGLFLFWLGELAGEYFSIYLSLWLLGVGACWLHLGRHKLKIIAFPLLICLTMFPPPHFIFQKITFGLKLISSKLGVDMMQAFGMTAFREGNIIDLGFTQLQVVDACSGLRYLIPLIVLGLVLSYFYKGALWKKALLVLFTIPLTVLTNSLRIALTGLLSEIWGPAAAEGFFHGFSGWFIFMFSCAVMLGLMWFLNKVFKEKGNEAPGSTLEAERGNHGEGEAQSAKLEVQRVNQKTAIGELKHGARGPRIEAPRKAHLTRFLSFGGLLVISLVVYQSVDFREKVPNARPFGQFPLSLGTWKGDFQAMAQKFIDTLDLSDYAIIDYAGPKGEQINFYVAYYKSQSKGESIHSPATCLPGSGWEFNQTGRVAIPLEDKAVGTMPVNRAVILKSGYRQLSYYWFPMRGRVLTSAYELKLYNFWDALTRQRTDGALVRLITPIGQNEEVADADARLQAFTRELVPVLDAFLPR